MNPINYRRHRRYRHAPGGGRRPPAQAQGGLPPGRRGPGGARAILDKAREEGDKIKREAAIEAREKDLARQKEFETQNREKQRKINETERRLINKEENLERRFQSIERNEKDFSQKERRLAQKEKDVEVEETKIAEAVKKAMEELERVSGMTQEEAKAMLIRKIEDEARLEAVPPSGGSRRKPGRRPASAREIISGAIQRSAAEHVVETTVSVVDLPSDDMKGRIIGREGRNIRALEMATGVDIIVDDTPEAVILSSFDPIRREVARLAIQKLVIDGRIHPARIEDIVENGQGRPRGEDQAGGRVGRPRAQRPRPPPRAHQAPGPAQVPDELRPERPPALEGGGLPRGHDGPRARPRHRTSPCGRASSTTSARPSTGRSRARTPSSASSWPRSTARPRRSCQAIATHHRDVDFPSIEAVLVQAADTLSAARPGARRELLETYIKRLEKLEEIADVVRGRLQGLRPPGRPRDPDHRREPKISDDKAAVLAKDIAAKIKNELDYPGQIKVTVIREMRAVEYAR